MNPLWQKNDSENTDRSWFYRFTTEEDRNYDAHLIPFDIFCNLAQAAMLKRENILSYQEYEDIRSALVSYYLRWTKGEFQLDSKDEDVHSCIERCLTADCGDAGKKIHTARSRNDQVMTDMRLFMKAEILRIVNQWLGIARRFHDLAQTNTGIYFAGLTHTQPAMPTSADAWFLSFMDLILCDSKSLITVFSQIDRSPLGSAAGYGVPYFNPNQSYTASLLGFSEVQFAVNAVQPSRGILEKKLCDSLGYGALTFNRLAGDIILYAHPSFGFVRLSDDQTSGSSIMPQKRNPDAWELIRASYHEFSGASSALASISANLSSGYHRDLQLTKKLIMESLFKAKSLANAVAHCLDGLTINKDACLNSLTAEVFATHYANKQVAKGVPFREAYRHAARSINENHIPDVEQLKSTYLAPGSPGNPETEALNKAYDKLNTWLLEQRNKQDTIFHNLLTESYA
jgi:argininosuccinate lyase